METHFKASSEGHVTCVGSCLVTVGRVNFSLFESPCDANNINYRQYPAKLFMELGIWNDLFQWRQVHIPAVVKCHMTQILRNGGAINY